jgi:pimeloyl-ACP methyl ester carboxylesterase
MNAITLFLPGAGGQRGFWQPVASRCRHAGQALHFAWPGFGDEPADPSIKSLDDLYCWLVARIPEGRLNLVAQSMGCVLALRWAIEQPERVRRLVLAATSGGTAVARAGYDWRPDYRKELPGVPDWFERDPIELGPSLGRIRAPTLLLFGDLDPIAPVSVGAHLGRVLLNARLVIIAGGSHAFALERPEEVARAIDQHLARFEPDDS